ncbi:CPBP family intramembrane glutamic endopeptidase [Mixta calida]|uniref:CPBP family intramembrane glutamic endopeptidase n=1 Tax=Mixta calida TaxID=665913 RepID=UPI002909444C|nr:CPBP family intramembrane glutamic endopeptidase [Mixta calida]MDU3817087.1 CPBP family intramembrane glutamic endopeptidase [Pantoea sp.]MDU6537186.1 CPBP family intramembrane glutamic endopeptidase [Mixta calida]
MWYLLAAALLALLFFRPAAKPLLLATLALALWQQALLWPGLLLLAGLTLVAWLRTHYAHHVRLMPLFEAVLAAGAVALTLHLAPGFHNQPVVVNAQAGPLSAPFTFYYNLDKALVPFILLACLPTLVQAPASPPRSRFAWPLLIAAIPALLLVATLAGGLRIEPHFPAWLGAFALANLFFVSLAEEALFRAWLQQRLRQRFGAWPALLVAALVFGLAHFAGGPLLIFFATLAGLLYGLAWQWSGRLWVATLVHFAFNLTHLLLFTYPVLQR